MSLCLKGSEVNWLDHSRMDPQGRLFYYNDRLYRAMKRFDKNFYTDSLELFRKNKAMEKGIIRTTVSDLEMEGATVILEHERLTPFLRPNEWSSKMFFDAALFHCDLHIELAKSRYNLQDAHLWNVTFKNCHPQYVDFGSIINKDSYKLRYLLSREYTHYMIHPLYLIKKKQAAKARRYLTHSNPPLGVRDLVGYFGPVDILGYPLRTFLTSSGLGVGLENMLKSIRSHIKSLFPPKERSPWKQYHEDESHREKENWHDKQKTIHKILTELNPKTVLDVGAATGWYSFLAAESGSQVISIDTDNEMVNTIYEIASKKGLAITPAVKDIFSKDPSHDNLSSEMVLALAIIHHLFFTQRFSFDYIAKTLSGFSTRWLIFEFIDHNDRFVKNQLKICRNEHPQTDYSLSNLLDSLRKYFKNIECFNSSSNNRTLLLCGKR